MAEYKIKQNSEIIFDKNRNLPSSPDSLWVEYIKLEYEVLKSHNPTNNPNKIARFKELKDYFENGKMLDVENAEKSKQAFDKAIEKIRSEIIKSDESPDNSVLYTAITNFKKRNE